MANLSQRKLLSSASIKGADVYNRAGDHLGHVDDLLIDPQSGKVAYAMLEFGGFLGLGSSHHPVPFAKLRHDATKDGYVTELTRNDLEGAPPPEAEWMADRDWEERSHRHYGVSPYWI